VYERGLEVEAGGPPPGAPPRSDRDNRLMRQYLQELKDSLLARRLAPNNGSVSALAQERQIPKDTLYGGRVAVLGRVKPMPSEALLQRRPEQRGEVDDRGRDRRAQRT
jgi:hypothetical protein